MRAVWKFPIQRGYGSQTITMPAGAQIVDVGVQDDLPVLWAVVNVGDNVGLPEDREFTLVNTGDEIPHGFRIHRGTMVSGEGGVWHLFEWQQTGDKAAGSDMRGGPVP